MERFFDRFVGPVGEPFEAMGGEWLPRLDVTETKDAMVVKAEMPGVEAKDLAVTLMGDLLTLRGEREKGADENEQRYHRMERTYGTFLRSVRLPMPVDGTKVTATFKNGVLIVTLPKTPAAKGTLIPVKEE
jgi:HSP20 family protein